MCSGSAKSTNPIKSELFQLAFIGINGLNLLKCDPGLNRRAPRTGIYVTRHQGSILKIKPEGDHKQNKTNWKKQTNIHGTNPPKRTLLCTKAALVDPQTSVFILLFSGVACVLSAFMSSISLLIVGVGLGKQPTPASALAIKHTSTTSSHQSLCASAVLDCLRWIVAVAALEIG